MKHSKPEIFPGEVSATSRPAIVNGVVVVGSTVADDQRIDAPSDPSRHELVELSLENRNFQPFARTEMATYNPARPGS
jgi:hypothetical protein